MTEAQNCLRFGNRRTQESTRDTAGVQQTPGEQAEERYTLCTQAQVTLT